MVRTMMAVSGLLLGGAAMAQSNDALPTSVRGLDVTVYSGTAAGLKWRRATDDRGVRGYEVYREGGLIGEFDALSYIATDLVPGSLNNFSVVTVDTAGQRSFASTGVAFLTPGGQTPVSRPMTPELRAAIYSSTAAGLVWTRPTDTSTVALRVAHYELRRDGVLVSSTRDASYIETALEGGRTYAYELVAINPLGFRSEPARVSVTTPGRSAGGSGGGPGPAAPTGLRSIAYSMTAGAIAWERAATAGLRHEVLRDGASLGITDGTSYVDSALSGARSYRYDVVAINRQGRRSAASSVTLSTPGGSGGTPTPPVEPTALDAVSDDLIVAFAGYAADAAVADVRALAEDAIDGALGSRALADTSTTFPDGLATDTVEIAMPTTNTEYDCAFGGRLAIGVARLEVNNGVDYSRRGAAETYRFDECRLAAADAGDVVLDGDLGVLDDSDSGNRFSTRTLTYGWSDFSRTSGETTVLEIDGSTVFYDENTELPSSTRTVALARYAERSGSGELVERLDDASLTLRTGREGSFAEYDLTLSGTITDPSTDGVGVAVDTVTAFSRRYRADLDDDPSAKPFTGELSFRAEDGRTLTVTARDTRTDELFVDRLYTGPDGEVRETENVPFAELTTDGPDGVPPRPQGAPARPQ